jgi:hypothetical protein
MIIEIPPMFVEFFFYGKNIFIVKSQYDNRDYQVINLKNGFQPFVMHYPNVVTKGGHQKRGQTKICEVRLLRGFGNIINNLIS